MSTRLQILLIVSLSVVLTALLVIAVPVAVVGLFVANNVRWAYSQAGEDTPPPATGVEVDPREAAFRRDCAEAARCHFWKVPVTQQEVEDLADRLAAHEPLVAYIDDQFRAVALDAAGVERYREETRYSVEAGQRRARPPGIGGRYIVLDSGRIAVNRESVARDLRGGVWKVVEQEYQKRGRP